eukprot:709673-Amphidinium_carterae.1
MERNLDFVPHPCVHQAHGVLVLDAQIAQIQPLVSMFPAAPDDMQVLALEVQLVVLKTGFGFKVSKITP